MLAMQNKKRSKRKEREKKQVQYEDIKPNDERAMLLGIKNSLRILDVRLSFLINSNAPFVVKQVILWFHAEAFGLSSENIDKLIGFRCHMCRQRNPPVCPHLVVVKTDVSQLAEAQNDAGDGYFNGLKHLQLKIFNDIEVKFHRKCVARQGAFLCDEVVAAKPCISRTIRRAMNRQEADVLQHLRLATFRFDSRSSCIFRVYEAG
ncbi:unnamed protein product [Prunus armeniaca]|uniref:Uncharacterized protein n=1 Tax=Prunus armeniaca TaxID=36596 RepID=A0A6J5UP56_PRUAR|nr:unnamed protein product [Prunus armeniaca]